MDLDTIYGELKEKFKDDIFSEGVFKVLVGSENEIALQTEAVVLKSGAVLPKDWEIFEEAIYNFDGVPGTATVFENSNGKFPCMLYDENGDSPVQAIVPGVQLSEEFDERLVELMSQLNTPEDFYTFQITPAEKEAWQNYMNAKENKAKLKM